ncbi:Uncharacterised protein [Mycolicibacterium smegmatis]|nr:Uncharacterised protein [Mycolicibacterium smegmatis]
MSGGDVVTVVVTRLVAGQRQQTHECDGQRRDQDGRRPPHDSGTDSPPAPHPHLALGIQQAEPAGHGDTCWHERDSSGHSDSHADGARDAHCMEVRKPREGQAENRTRDGQPGCHHNRGDAPIHAVVGRFSVLAELACLLVAAEEKDAVIRARCDREEHQHVDGECRQDEHVVGTEEGHDAAGGRHLEPHHDQQQNNRDHRSIDEKKHREDDHDRHRGDLQDRAVTAVLQVGNQRCRTGDVDRDALGRVAPVDEISDRRDRLVTQWGSLIACQIQLDIGGLAVGALCARRSETIAPEILDVLDVTRVGAQVTDQVGVVVVGILAERFGALQHDHREAVGVGLLELLPHALDRLCGRGVLRHQGDRVLLAHLFERWDGRSPITAHGSECRHEDEDQPSQNDEGRQRPYHPRDERAIPLLGVQLSAHTGFASPSAAANERAVGARSGGAWRSPGAAARAAATRTSARAALQWTGP